MPTRIQGIVALLVASFIWGSTVPFAVELRQYFSREWILFFRFAFAAVLFAPLLWRVKMAEVVAGAILGAVLFLVTSLQTEAVAGTTPARSAFFMGVHLLVVPLLMLISGQRPGRRMLLAMGVAAAGHFALCWESGPWRMGDTLALVTGVLYGAFIVLMERCSVQVESTLRMTVVLLLTRALCGAAWVLPSAEFTAHGNLEDLAAYATPFGLYCIAATGVVYALLAWGQRRISANEAAVVFTFDSIAPVLSAALLGLGGMTAREVAASVLLGAGLLISQWRPRSRLPAAQPGMAG